MIIARLQRQAYRIDLTDAEWHILRPCVPQTQPGGRPTIHNRRVIVNAIFYNLRSGCLALLLKDFRSWKTMYHYFRLWHSNGIWQRLHTGLREQLRVRLRHQPQPSAGVIDSQSVKTTSIGGLRRYDGGKKVKGWQRNVLVDTQGLLLRALIHPAGVMDRDGSILLLQHAPDEFVCLRHVWLDSGYNGKGKGKDWISTP